MQTFPAQRRWPWRKGARCVINERWIAGLDRAVGAILQNGSHTGSVTSRGHIADHAPNDAAMSILIWRLAPATAAGP